MLQGIQNQEVVESKSESNSTQSHIEEEKSGVIHQERLVFERLRRTEKTRYWAFSQQDSELSDAVTRDANQVVFSSEEEV